MGRSRSALTNAASPRAAQVRRGKKGGGNYVLYGGACLLLTLLAVTITATATADEDESVFSSALRLVRLA